MKKILIAFTLTIAVHLLNAQVSNTEKEIRQLEQMEVKAILEKDTVTLLKLWDKDYVVNAPDNVVTFAGRNTVDRPVMKRARTSFTREIEHIIITGTTVFAMGTETVIPSGDQPRSGQTIKRRYTNVWMHQDGTWKLVARHANVICQ